MNEGEIMTSINPDDVSPTFCVLPWIHVATKTVGTAQICCVSEQNTTSDDGRVLRLGRDSYDDVFNSTHFREVRAAMLRGERVPACQQCYAEEALGTHSVRRGMSEHWLRADGEEIMRRVRRSRELDFRVDSPPLYLDLRQGNLCNLKCRMCVPQNSVMLQREFTSIAARDPWFRDTIHDGRVDPEIADWYAKPKFLDEVRALLPTLRSIYFTGGEPTLIESNYALMQECIDRGFAGKISLFFNTNVMQLPDQFLEMLPKFESTILSLSVDGVGAVQEYIRPPSRWATIDKHLRRFAGAALPNVILLANPTVQIFNAVNITELFRYFDSLNREYNADFRMLPNILHIPRYLDMVLLPKPIRELAVARLTEYADATRDQGRLHPAHEGRIAQIVARLSNEPPADAPELLKTFVGYTTTLDRERGHSLAASIPELASLVGG